MKYLHIYFLSLALMISFDLNASKYDKESASDLYKKATKQLKEEDYKNALKTLKKYTKSKNFLYLGRGYNFPVALELSLIHI